MGRPKARREGDRVEAVDILIAESDPVEADRVRDALRPVLNSVTVFHDGERAADYLLQRGEFAGERRTPDMILLDAELIGDGCWRLLKRLRSEPRYDDALIAVISSDPSLEKAERAREAGVTWFVGKPVKIETLALLVEDLEDMGLAVIRARGLPGSERQVFAQDREES